MVDHLHDNEDDGSSALSPRSIGLLLGALVAAFAVGLAVWGTAGEVAPTVADGASGCKVHALRYTVTDDPAEFARQKRFESTLSPIPDPGFYDRRLDEVATLHAASHAYVVVFARDDVGGDGEAGLRALERAALRSKAPVLVSRRGQEPAIVALSRGYELTCQQGGAAQAAEVRRFAAQEYATVADPDDASTTPPAPTSPNEAPSPAQP